VRALGLAVLLALAAAGPAAASPKEPLRTERRCVTDAKGRVWITHGVNMVYKRKPYVPADTGFGRDDARFLRRHGFNSVRLGAICSGVEPARGSYDRDYLERVRATARVLARAGVFTQAATAPGSRSGRTARGCGMRSRPRGGRRPQCSAPRGA
jgi:endoglycosylceramidase